MKKIVFLLLLGAGLFSLVPVACADLNIGISLGAPVRYRSYDDCHPRFSRPVQYYRYPTYYVPARRVVRYYQAPVYYRSSNYYRSCDRW